MHFSIERKEVLVHFAVNLVQEKQLMDILMPSMLLKSRSQTRASLKKFNGVELAKTVKPLIWQRRARKRYSLSDPSVETAYQLPNLESNF